MRRGAIAVGIVGILVAGSLRAQPAPSRSVWDGVYTKAQADRGRSVYAASCESCHLQPQVGGEMAPPLAGLMFTATWDGTTLGDLYERIRTTMPEDAPGSLTAAENADVIAFLLSANGFPEGKTELPRVVAALNVISLQATKPDN